MLHPFETLRPEYEALLATVKVTRTVAVKAGADEVMAAMARYKKASQPPPATMPPAAFIGALDLRESDCDPKAGLGQGDPWNRVSTHVPRGCGPFASWDAAARFYIHYDHLDDLSVPQWTLAYACWKGEIWNGFGYRSHGIHSSYLWGSTNHQQRGKYVADGVWDGSAVDNQIGIVPVMLELIARDPSLAFGHPIAPPPIVVVPVTPSPFGTLDDVRTLQGLLNAVLHLDPPLVIDGSYGRRTREAVRIFQAAHGLVADGLAGPATWPVLRAAHTAPAAVVMPIANPIAGLPCDYLIGASEPGNGRAGRFTVVGFDVDVPVGQGVSGAYVNLLVEPQGNPPEIPNRFAPFIEPTGTAADYDEGIPDPKGPGFDRNVREQLDRRKGQFAILGDIDNPDTFTLATVTRVYDVAHAHGFQIICKNPGLGCSSVDGDSDAEKREDATYLVSHPAVIGIICEEGAGTPAQMDAMRHSAGKKDLMVYFVAHAKSRTGLAWAKSTAKGAHNYYNMGVTYSENGEYGSSRDLLVPIPPPAA